MSPPLFLQSAFALSCRLVFNNLCEVVRPERCGRPALAWNGDEHNVVFIDMNSTRVFAKMWHDGCGKFYPTIYVTVPTALRLLFVEPAITVSFRNVPYVGIELIRLKAHSMDEACTRLDEYMSELKMI